MNTASGASRVSASTVRRPIKVNSRSAGMRPRAILLSKSATVPPMLTSNRIAVAAMKLINNSRAR